LFSTAFAPSSVVRAADTAQAPAPMYSDPASACLGSGGKYLGDMKCQMADGSVAAILSGADATRARNSAAPVTPRSPHAWALATTAITFEFNGGRHDLLTGSVATPDGLERGKHLLSKWWNVDDCILPQDPDFIGIFYGGEGGIRTLDGLLTHTPLAGARLRPLGHLSGQDIALIAERRMIPARSSPGKAAKGSNRLGQARSNVIVSIPLKKSSDFRPSWTTPRSRRRSPPILLVCPR
jgi:hypothetical protein